MDLFWMLVSASGVSAVLLAISAGWYWHVRRTQASETSALDDSEDDRADAEVVVDDTVSQTERWLELIDQQLVFCQELLEQQRAVGEDDLTLRCWQTFLNIERILLQQQDANFEDYLDQFEFVLEQLKHAQEIDALLKQLTVSNQLLKHLNKIVQTTSESVFEQVNITANLNLKLEQLQERLQAEVRLDKELAGVREELASLFDMAEQLKQQVDTQEEQDKVYMEMLSEFLGSVSSDSFLSPIKNELDEKVHELQHLADYRAQVIAELKERLKTLRSASAGQQDYIAECDIACARFEKSLLESNKVIKALEQKLESLQTIKYNLNVDRRKREEALKVKDAALRAKGVETKLKAQAAIAREQSSVDAIVDFMDKVPLSAEFSDFETQQSEKLATLQQLVNESELYVSVLERDLEKEKFEHEQLLARQQQGGAEPPVLSTQEQEELRNLREVNSELEEEKIRLLEQLSATHDDGEAIQVLQQRIKELDMKIETLQINYVNMEERYLNSLMS
ncbi:hypothetical protein MAQ5080_02816 [Marinomonas aquimarina]|uniref:Uncharacterized protein n=1 Tax=Marinomonas aquimarina TaxID=295068 RepID=A0A1A8TNL5_9GAMM|nr:hypothetical protein [Marinomonas aquimarina]SBS34245.1 hypothetical protein MAQ5080_02816 [Marinomonas aquimarina]